MKKLLLLFTFLAINANAQIVGDVRTSAWNGTGWQSSIWSDAGSESVPLIGTFPLTTRPLAGTGSILTDNSSISNTSGINVDIQNAINASTAGFGEVTATITTGTATVNVSGSNQILITGTSQNTDVVITNMVAGKTYRILANSGTFVNPTLTFPAGTTQSLSGTNIYTLTGTGVARVDIIPFIYSGTSIRIMDASVYYTP